VIQSIVRTPPAVQSAHAHRERLGGLQAEVLAGDLQFCGAVYVSSSTRSHARALVIASVLIRPMRETIVFMNPFYRVAPGTELKK